LEILGTSLVANPLELVREKITEAISTIILDDPIGTLDVILFPDVYRTAKSFINSNMPMLITGMMEMDAGREEPYLGRKVLFPQNNQDLAINPPFRWKASFPRLSKPPFANPLFP